MGHKTRQQFMIRAIPALIAAAFAGTAATAHAAGEALEEVIITAQKRSENLQDVPISVMSFDAKALEKKGVITLSDINDGSVPGLSLAPYPGSSEIFFPTFRGVTTNSSFIANPNPIAVHVNGVYQSQLVGLNNPAADLERIEVLKGPQGVMSGRNATGGALNIYTAKPDLSAFGFKQQITLAQREQFISKTTVNVPVTENLAVKIAYVHSSRDNEGIRNSAPNGVKFGEREADAWRFDLRWKPANNVTVDYGYDYSKSEGYDTPPQCLRAAPSYLALATYDARSATFVNGCRTDRQDSLYGPSGIQKNRNQAEGHALNIEWEASPTLTVRSITGYRKVDTSNQYNYGAYVGGLDARADSYPLTITDPLNVNGGASIQLGSPAKLYNEAWSQEFQFLGDVSKTFKYTAGVFFASEKGNQHSGPNLGMNLTGGGGASNVDFIMVDNKGIHSSKLDSWAVFGQLNWTPDILEQKLEIVPGIRFTKDHRRVVGYNTGWTTGYITMPTGASSAMLLAAPFSIAAPGVGFASAAAERRYSQTTPALSLNYHVNKGVMTYLKLSKGFTAGGFDQVSGGASAAGFVKGFDPETIKSVELGMKGEFMDRRLRTNMALFQSKFDNEQKSVFNGIAGWATQNVGGSTYKGFEFDLTARVTDDLRASFSYATLSHHYDKWIDPSTQTDVTNRRKLIVPKNDATLTLDYRFPNLGLPGKLDGSLTFSHRGATSTPINFDASPNIEQESTVPSFSVVNARLALSRIKVGPGANGDLTVALWGKNLADKKYLVMSNPGWTSAWSGNWGEPRTYGLDLIYQY
ncbi:putative TonB-dependent receptor [Denitratisoma oestradiolicum]|uniref:Putative TonB-dependent receptor n=2 Tax=Denitratisoma oestradiolicum TaxID=311182 RepID=A0A6S6Y5L7_9PROT|nr:putative TonB-dependent receptor [Denitratisoma oestradiolicum]